MRVLSTLAAVMGVGFGVGCGAGEARPASPTITSERGPVAPSETSVSALPEPIRSPVGQSLLFKLSAKGAQIYSCRPKADDAATFEWALKAPDAELFDGSGKRFGKHYAGPTWEAADGSKVLAQKKAQVDAREAGSIPWLLLEAKSTEGKGAFERVQSIQRVDTTGGRAPASGCDAAHSDAETRVPYTAVYYFNGTP